MIERRQILEAMKQSTQKGVLATIIHIEGSSYRKIGTSMLFLEDGQQVGILSGGCLEQRVAYDAQRVMSCNAPTVHTYDLEEDDLLGLGETSGCPGVITILLEPVTQNLIADWVKLNAFLTKGISITVIKNLATFESAYRTKTGETFGSNSEQEELKRGSTLPLFQYTYPAEPRLIIFGAGEDTLPLTDLALGSGFHVVVSDWREALCKQERFKADVELIHGFPSETAEKLDIDSRDYVVLMTHHLKYDRDILLALREKQVKYLGILGSKKRLQRLQSQVNDDSLPLAALHAPIGLPIAAEGPYEIAISIIAEVIACRRGALAMKTVGSYEK